MPRPEYQWEESNLALFGSPLEKQIKQAAAEGEEAWDDVGFDAEVRVWRIEKFRVVPPTPATQASWSGR